MMCRLPLASIARAAVRQHFLPFSSRAGPLARAFSSKNVKPRSGAVAAPPHTARGAGRTNTDLQSRAQQQYRNAAVHPKNAPRETLHRAAASQARRPRARRLSEQAVTAARQCAARMARFAGQSPPVAAPHSADVALARAAFLPEPAEILFLAIARDLQLSLPTIASVYDEMISTLAQLYPADSGGAGQGRLQRKLRADVVHVTLEELQRRRAWKEASAVVRMLPSLAVSPDLRHYVTAIRACTTAFQTDAAAELLQEVLRLGLKPHMTVFNALLQSCARTGHSDLALHVLSTMQWAGTTPNNVSITTAMRACIEGGHCSTAIRLFDEFAFMDASYSERARDPMPLHELISVAPPRKLIVASNRKSEHANVQTASLGSASAIDVPWIEAYDATFFSSNRKFNAKNPGQMRPDRVMYNTALSAVRNGSGSLAYALELVAQMKAAPTVFEVQPDRITYTNLVKACSDFGEHAYAQQIWAWAFRSAAARNALRQKPVVVDGVGKPKLLSPDAAAFTAGIAAFSESGDWEVAKNILFEAERLADDAFTEAPRAQASSAQNKKTKSHESKNQKMRRLRSLQPSVGAYRAILMACRKAGQVSEASKLLKRLNQRSRRFTFLRPDLACHNEVLRAFMEAGTGYVEEALGLCKLMVKRGIADQRSVNMAVAVSLAAGKLDESARLLSRLARPEGMEQMTSPSNSLSKSPTNVHGPAVKTNVQALDAVTAAADAAGRPPKRDS